MEEYFQEAGCAGRDGLPAKATIYYNAYDTSKAKRGLQDIMINRNTKKMCPYFFRKQPKENNEKHD